MRFGIFYEHQLPRPWTDDSEYRLIQDALEQIAYADSIGIAVLADRLSRLADSQGERFRPAGLLREMVREERGFYAG